MAWTETTRLHYRRETLRYASDLTNAEWALIAPFLPSAGKLGRPRKTDLRSVVEAILYMTSTGCQWRAIPKDFPPYSTVQGYFYAWSHRGLLAHINHMLVMVERTFAWLGRCRRLAKDFEASLQSAMARILVAHIQRLTRRRVRA